MTFQVLSQAPTQSLNFEEVPYLTEEQEAEKWAILTGKVSPDGDDGDMIDDLRMLGLS